MVSVHRSVSGTTRSFIVLALCIVPFFLANAQKPTKSTVKTAPATTSSSAVVLKTTKESVSLPEFEAAYKRMNDKDPYITTLDSLKDFLVIYGDYRLKLLDARSQHLDTDPKIQKEMQGYRELLAGPFILDKQITEPAVQKMFERRKVEISASHFLAMVKNWNDPKDTLKAYNRAIEAIKRLKSGEVMATVVMSDRVRHYNDDPGKAKMAEVDRANKLIAPDSGTWEGSDDKSSIPEGGSLGWFTSGQTIRQFEDAAYSLEIGHYTEQPVRTKFGYHVIQLDGKRPRLGGVKVHHILVSFPRDIKRADTLSYFKRADSLLRAIRAGAKFEDVARQSSDDKFSADKGGDIGITDHDTHRTERDFDAAVYALKDGQISGLVRSSKGYHIIRRDESLPAKTFDQEKDFLKKLYKNYYFNEDKQQYLSNLRRQNGAAIVFSSVDIFLSRVDSSRTSSDSNWAVHFTPGERGLILYSINNQATTIAAFIDSLNAQPGYPLARNMVNDFINKHLDDEALKIAAKNVSTEYPDFEKMMADYQNGIMLFELENRRVWTQVKPDSTAELAFYNDHKARFLWPERIDVSEIYVMSDTLAKSLYKRIRDNGENFDTLAAQYTERPGYKKKAGHWGLLTKDENEMSKKAFSIGVDDVGQPFSFQSGYSIVKINRRVPITQKTFQEARQEVASQYQDDQSNELRQKWVQELRKKYKLELSFKPLEESYARMHPATSQNAAPASGM